MAPIRDGNVYTILGVGKDDTVTITYEDGTGIGRTTSAVNKGNSDEQLYTLCGIRLSPERAKKHLASGQRKQVYVQRGRTFIQ